MLVEGKLAECIGDVVFELDNRIVLVRALRSRQSPEAFVPENIRTPPLTIATS